ncbi:uncharacterized protein KZ484_016733 [Pholidichthys leucotaenia]
MDNLTALFISYVLYALICVQMRCTLSLVTMVLFEGRRQRRVLLECSNNAISAMLHSAPSLLPGPSRRCWMRVRNKDWWERIVLKQFSDDEWREHFRMTRRSFDKLCGLMEGIMSPQDVTVRAPVPLQMRIAIVLYKLASCAEYRVVANQFGVHKSTVKKFVYCFCKGMVSSVIHCIIKMPTAEEARAIATRFEQKYNIPQIIGFIDGTHIPVLPPSDGFKDFVNLKGWPSYVLQAVVDDMCRFWDIDCKMPGCTQEAQVLKQSPLYGQIHQLPKEPREINGTTVNLFLLGGLAYPLTDWLIKGYPPSLHITPEQNSFNVCLSAARTTVETAFSRLKSRWKVLLRRNDFHYTFTPHVIATCCALHNFCENEKEHISPAWAEEAKVLERGLPQPSGQPYTTSECSGGQKIRLALTEYLKTNFSSTLVTSSYQL